jgi:hypothetical protein
MNGSASKRRGGTDLEHHRALSLENVKSELASGQVELARLRERDPTSVDPDVAARLEAALLELEKIVKSAEH